MEARLAAVLATSDVLTRSLDKRLVSKRREDPAKTLPERIAGRILALKTGLGATRNLVEICFDAVLGRDADARGERRVTRELLCEWLPYGYPEIAQVVVLRVGRTGPDPRNLEITTAYDHFVEIHMARIDGRRCKFTKMTIDSRGGRYVAEGMLPVPPHSSQRQGANAVADLIVEVIRERFGSPTAIDVDSRIWTEARKGAPLYLVVRAEQRPDVLPDAAIRRLNIDFKELRIAVVNSPATDQVTKDESKIWTMFDDIFDDAR